MPSIEHKERRRAFFDSPWQRLRLNPLDDFEGACAASFTPCGSYCAIGTIDGQVYVWEFKTTLYVARVLRSPNALDAHEVISTAVTCLTWGRDERSGWWELAVGYERMIKCEVSEEGGPTTATEGFVVGWDLTDNTISWTHRYFHAI